MNDSKLTYFTRKEFERNWDKAFTKDQVKEMSDKSAHYTGETTEQKQPLATNPSTKHMRTDKEIDNAFKPDGITDNRNEWLLKNIKRKHPSTFWARMLGLDKLILHNE